MSRLYPDAERERRIQIIQEGMKTDFWKVLKESVEYWCSVKSVEVVELHSLARHGEAQELARDVSSAIKMVNEPYQILKHNKPMMQRIRDLFKERENVAR